MDLKQLLADLKEEHKSRIVKMNPNRDIRTLMEVVAPDMFILGSGAFGAVYEMPDDPTKVIRISYYQFDNWFQAARYGEVNCDSNFIKVYEIIQNGIIAIAVVERLERYPHQSMYVTLRETLWKFERNEATMDDVVAHAESMVANNITGWTMKHFNSLLGLREYMKANNKAFNWDCFARNFMLRGDHLVITDPIS